MRGLSELKGDETAFETYHYLNMLLNNEYGYSVLNGLCDDFSKLVIKNVPPNSVVVLASDGYPILMPTLESSEIKLERLKEDDPLCIHNYKSTTGWTNGKKALDDRAYIRFKI